MRYIKISTQIKYLYKDDKVFQYFIVVDSKLRKYALDSKYLINREFEDFIRDTCLALQEDGYIYLYRRDEEDRIVIVYSIPKDVDFKKQATCFYTLAGPVPINTGCEDCAFLKESSDGLIYCDKKERNIPSKMKRCRFFNQKG